VNNTNRALNRVLLLIIGLLFLALGAVGIAIMSWPTATDIWTSAGENARSWLDQAIAATAIAGGSLSWIGIGAVVAILVVVVLLILALTSIAGRRSKTAFRSTGAQNPLGRVTVTESFVSDAVKNSLATRDEILSTRSQRTTSATLRCCTCRSRRGRTRTRERSSITSTGFSPTSPP